MGDARDDIRFMELALRLAGRRDAGRVSPNPRVGCVLVKDGAIIGEGWHEGAGEPHAEIAALKNAAGAARGATAYVTLEPCNHTGRTGPCVEALIDAGVAEVVYAVADPNPLAAGGAERLRAAGVKARRGVCEDDARSLIRHWLHRAETKQPYVVAKFAASLDGKIAAESGDSKWITGAEARAEAHAIRREVDAILVGANTVIADDPSLTARSGEHVVYEPLRIVLDSTARTSPGAKVFDRSGRGALLATTDAAPAARLAAFREHGVEILRLPAIAGRPDVTALLDHLGAREINSVLVEGGGETLGAFFDAGAVNEVAGFIAPIIIGGGKPSISGVGIDKIADALRLHRASFHTVGGDIFVRGRVGEQS